MTWIALIVGAAAGAPLRHLVDVWVTDRTAARSTVRPFPWGLLVVNVSGSAIAGVVLALTTGDVRVLLLTGFCGAFTTFSGFAWEADRLWNIARSWFWAAVVVMPVACIGAFLVAWRMAVGISA
jgi:CrcB protein